MYPPGEPLSMSELRLADGPLEKPKLGEKVVLAPGYRAVEDAGASSAALKPGLEGTVERINNERSVLVRCNGRQWNYNCRALLRRNAGFVDHASRSFCYSETVQRVATLGGGAPIPRHFLQSRRHTARIIITSTSRRRSKPGQWWQWIGSQDRQQRRRER